MAVEVSAEEGFNERLKAGRFVKESIGFCCE